MSRRICDTPDCGDPRADDCRFCPECRESILDEIAEEYDGLDLEHHEMPQQTYEGPAAGMFHYIECRRDKR